VRGGVRAVTVTPSSGEERETLSALQELVAKQEEQSKKAITLAPSLKKLEKDLD
jgi:hypothetical protein